MLSSFQTLWDVVSALFTFVMGWFLLIALRKGFNAPLLRVSGLYCWHTLFCLLYAWYAQSNVADAISYYRTAESGVVRFLLGTAAVEYLTFLLVQGLGLSYIGAFLVYNVFGALGLLAFDAALRAATRDKPTVVRLLATVIVLLPSVSFWSASIGKDALAFMSVGLALWAAIDFRGRAWLMALAVLAMLLVRPHMAALMVAALAASALLHSKTGLIRRVVLGAVALGCLAVLVPYALNYAGLHEVARAQDVLDYIQTRQVYNLEGGGAVDIASMSLPMKLFTYLFRPLPFEARSLYQFAASLDNGILVLVMCLGPKGFLLRRRPGCDSDRAFLWVYVVASMAVLSLTTANLGIAVRQKWMFLPMLLFLVISVTGRRRRTPR